MKKSIHENAYRVVMEWLRQERNAARVTMQELSMVLGVSHTWVSKVETGERRLDVLEYVRLCRALKLDPAVGLRLADAAMTRAEQESAG